MVCCGHRLPGGGGAAARLVVRGHYSERQGPWEPPLTFPAKAPQGRARSREDVKDGTPAGGPVLRGGGEAVRARRRGAATAGVPPWDPGPAGLRLLRMTGGGWSAVYRRRRRRHRAGGWDTASTRRTASPSSRGPRGGVPRGGAAAAGGAASRAAAEGARAEEALTSWSCRRRRRSEARPEGRRRRDLFITERVGPLYPFGQGPRAYRAARARRRGGATAGCEGGTRRTLACGRARPSGRKAAKRPAGSGG